ncbi:uncharacterized protein TRAVEDRAFT_54191 [Trametes versicolor FP-101664 SS1]|uniref:Uncharacterized protein n=1 Tax=Trametes versicolor (strain FP-101664) TaxID=717944 RepID=R7S7U8_TRAVS|nr:uncharacterized protein TRAVEDRAFT_54191 [Trametes versicolor FP-101664 SS1]EIW51765.1 hypothetical protein TRAVEDRAFT_54191 [Trametes versicolor FP-101664 SS1]
MVASRNSSTDSLDGCFVFASENPAEPISTDTSIIVDTPVTEVVTNLQVPKYDPGYADKLRPIRDSDLPEEFRYPCRRFQSKEERDAIPVLRYAIELSFDKQTLVRRAQEVAEQTSADVECAKEGVEGCAEETQKERAQVLKEQVAAMASREQFRILEDHLRSVVESWHIIPPEWSPQAVLLDHGPNTNGTMLLYTNRNTRGFRDRFGEKLEQTVELIKKTFGLPPATQPMWYFSDEYGPASNFPLSVDGMLKSKGIRLPEQPR